MKLIDAKTVSTNQPNLAEIRDIVLEVFRQHGSRNVENPPKQAVHTNERAFYHAMPAYLPSMNAAGTKLVGVYPTNPEVGLDSLTGVIAMFDPKTGIHTHIIDAEWITNMRTAMVTCVSAELFSRNTNRFVIVGNGAQAKYHVEALSAVFSGCEITIVGRSQEKVDKFIEENKHFDCTLIGETDLGKATRDADNIIVCTSKLLEPILDKDNLREGLSVFNVHSLGWTKDILKYVDRVFTDDKEQILDKHNGLTGSYNGLVQSVEVGRFLLKPREIKPKDIVFTFNYGLGIFDVAIAKHIIERIENGH